MCAGCSTKSTPRSAVISTGSFRRCATCGDPIEADREVCNAGHPPPFVVRADTVERLDATGLPVGMFPSAEFTSHTVWLAAGDALLLYTDGIIETRSETGDDYGIGRLASLSVSASRRPQALIDACLHSVAAFRGTPVADDDLTVVADSRNGRFRCARRVGRSFVIFVCFVVAASAVSSPA
jgi:serine phosphatase RsbU (regulator of sigma subunit)